MLRKSLLLLLLFPIAIFGQKNNNYKPIGITKSIDSYKAANIKTRYEANLKHAKTMGKQSSDLIDIYKTRNEDFNAEIEGGKFISGSKLNVYCEKVLNNILDANRNLAGYEINLLISRSAAPNAYSMGEGTIVINIGLLRRLETESQLAFVLCHELAHYFQDHFENAVNQRLTELYSKDTKKKMKNISNSKYGKTLKALELLKNLSYQSSRHSRLKEDEADDVGLSYFLKTKYNPLAALSGLSILSTIDEDKYPAKLDLKQFFGTLEYESKEDWYVYDPNNSFSHLGGNGLGWDNDSLKSHPDCDSRIATLATKLSNVSPKADFIVSEATFNEIKRICDYEIIESSYYLKDYGSALFHSLILLRVYPNDAYLHGMVGSCMAYLFEYQKNHRLNTVLELPDQRFGENYDRLLQFIHNLRLKEMGALAYYYQLPLKGKYITNENFLFGLLYASYASGKSDEANTYKQQYLNQFPQGRFKEEIETISEIYK